MVDANHGRDHIAQTEEPGVEAEHDIGSAEHEALIESTDDLEERAAQRDTGAGDRQGVAVPIGGTEMGVRVRGETHEQVVGETVDADDHSPVLDHAVAVDELQAHETDLGLERPPDHLAHPAGVDGLGVVVEEQEDLATGTRRCHIVHSRVVELVGPPQDIEIERTAVVDVPLLGLGAAATVVDDEHVEGGIVGGHERGKAVGHHRHVVSGRDDDRDMGQDLGPPHQPHGGAERDDIGGEPATFHLRTDDGDALRWPHHRTVDQMDEHAGDARHLGLAEGQSQQEVPPRAVAE